MEKQQTRAGPVLTARTAVGSGLRVTCCWSHDRFSHAIEWFDDSHRIPVLKAVEGDEETHWPPSPPLQQATLQPSPSGQPVALLIGMAGKSHWSASIEGTDRDPRCLVFDVACRVDRGPEWLGSSYHPLAPLGTVTADAVQISVGEAMAVWLTVDPLPGENGNAEIQIVGDRLCIVPPRTVIERRSTIRWKYRLSLDPPMPRSVEKRLLPGKPLLG